MGFPSGQTGRSACNAGGWNDSWVGEGRSLQEGYATHTIILALENLHGQRA